MDLGYAFLRWQHREGGGLHSFEGVPCLGKVWGFLGAELLQFLVLEF